MGIKIDKAHCRFAIFNVLHCISYDYYRVSTGSIRLQKVRSMGSLFTNPNISKLQVLINETNTTMLNKLTELCEHIGNTVMNEAETECMPKYTYNNFLFICKHHLY